MVPVDVLDVLFAVMAAGRRMHFALDGQAYQEAWEDQRALVLYYQDLCRQCGIMYDQQWLETMVQTEAA